MNESITKSKSPVHYGYVIVICCCLMMGIDVGVAMSCAGIFYVPVCHSIGVTTGEFGIYMSLSFLFSTLTVGYAGRLLERFSARWLLTGASALLGAVIALMGICNALWQFYIAGALIGISLAFLMYLSFPVLVNRWFRKNVGFIIGICSASSGIGGVLLNPVGGWIISSWGWHWGYIAFGLLILAVVTPLLALLLRDYPASKGLTPVGEAEAQASEAVSGSSVKTGGISFRDAVRTPSFYFLMVFAFMIMASSTLFLFLPKYAASVGFSIEQGALVAAGAMAGVTIGKLALGWINDRNCGWGVLTCSVGGIAGLVVMLTCSEWLWMIVAGAFLFGWCYAAVTVQTAILTRTRFGNLAYERIFSVVSIALAAGGTVASGAWGFIVDHTSFAFIFNLGIAMLALCLLTGVLTMRK